MDEHHVIISADSHCGADLRQYKDYLETKYHDEFDEWADVIEADQVKMDELYAGLEKSPEMLEQVEILNLMQIGIFQALDV